MLLISLQLRVCVHIIIKVVVHMFICACSTCVAVCIRWCGHSRHSYIAHGSQSSHNTRKLYFDSFKVRCHYWGVNSDIKAVVPAMLVRLALGGDLLTVGLEMTMLFYTHLIRRLLNSKLCSVITFTFCTWHILIY